MAINSRYPVSSFCFQFIKLLTLMVAISNCLIIISEISGQTRRAMTHPQQKKDVPTSTTDVHWDELVDNSTFIKNNNKTLISSENVNKDQYDDIHRRIAFCVSSFTIVAFANHSIVKLIMMLIMSLIHVFAVCNEILTLNVIILLIRLLTVSELVLLKNPTPLIFAIIECLIYVWFIALINLKKQLTRQFIHNDLRSSFD